jgi:hypothetical protein
MNARTTGIALVLTLCAASLHAADITNIDRTLPLSSSGAVTLDAHNGLIEIRTWDRGEVEIHVRIESQGTSALARQLFNDTTADIQGSPNLVSITMKRVDNVSWWQWLMSSGDWNSAPDIRYTITAPRTARWRIRNHNAKTDMRDVSAGVELETHNGTAHIEFASFTQASTIAMHNGSAELVLPASSKFEVQATGHHIRVHSDFPATTRAADFGRHDVDGQVNGGGPSLRLISHNGSFRLRSK